MGGRWRFWWVPVWMDGDVGGWWHESVGGCMVVWVGGLY